MHTWLGVQTLVILSSLVSVQSESLVIVISTVLTAHITLQLFNSCKRQSLSRCYWFSRNLCVDSIGRCNAVCPVCWPTSPITVVESTSSV